MSRLRSVAAQIKSAMGWGGLPWLALGVLMAWLWRDLLSGRQIVDLNVYRLIRSDSLELTYPLFRGFSLALKAGTFPLWCPLIFGGFPMAASSTGFFYPPNILLALVLPPLAAYNAAFLVAHAAAASTMALYARRLGLGTWGAALSALVYSSTGFFVGNMTNLNQIAALAWLPLLLYGVEDLLDGRTGRALRIGGCALALALLATTTQGAYYAGLAATAAALAGACAGPRRRPIPVLAAMAAMALVGFWLAAVQLLPLLESYSLSSYGGSGTLATALRYQLGWRDALRLIRRDQTPVFPEIEMFIGLLPLALAALGASAWWREPSRRRALLQLAAVALVGTAGISFGVPLFSKFLPGYSIFRFPMRMIVLVHLALAAWAGLGLERVRARLSGRGGLRALVTALALLVAAAEARGLIGARAVLAPAPDCPEPLGAWARAACVGGRALTLDPHYEGVNVFALENRSFGVGNRLLWPNTNLLCGFPQFLGNESLEPSALGRAWARLRKLQGQVEEGVIRARPEWRRLLSRLGVTVLLSRWRVKAEGIVPSAPPPPNWRPTLHGYAVEGAIPPARIVHRAEVEPDPERRLDRLQEAGFEPGTQTVVAVSPGVLEPPDAPERLETLRAGDSGSSYRATLSAPGLLVFQSAYHPGWKAWIDGRRSPVISAEALALAVRVPEGTHELELKFQPASVLAGAALSLAGWAFLAWTAWRGRR